MARTAKVATGACLLAAGLTPSLLAASAAPAQKAPPNSGPPNALQGFAQNRDQPVKIQAEGLVVRDKDKMATFSGNVHVTQGDTELNSRTLVVFYVDPNKPSAAATTSTKASRPAAWAGSGDQQQIRRIEATGDVRVTQKDQTAVGDTGIFDMRSNTVTLNGNVVVTRSSNVVRGQRLVVDLGSGVSHMDGGVDMLVIPGGGAMHPDARPVVP
jgi:lipopolysaccharide export system protein LptA